MRRSYLATLLLILAATTLAPGCHQTTGPSAGSPVIPLSPSGSGAAPNLLPFGGATRVTPPSAGTFNAPNSYLGGAAPNGQTNNSGINAGGFAAAPAGQAIGSGVRAAGWTETNSNSPGGNPNAGNFNSNPKGATFGLNPSSPNVFRQGGMQVNDLTGAPAPPGYRPQPPLIGGQQNFNQPQNFNQRQNFNQPQNFNQQGFNQQGFIPARTIQTPTAREFAGAVAPGPSSVVAQSPNRPLNSTGNLVPLNSGGGDPRFPSTNPINQASPTNPTQNTLNWRRPGTRF